MRLITSKPKIDALAAEQAWTKAYEASVFKRKLTFAVFVAGFAAAVYGLLWLVGNISSMVLGG